MCFVTSINLRRLCLYTHFVGGLIAVMGACDLVTAQDRRPTRTTSKLEIRVEEKGAAPPIYRTKNFAVQTDIASEEARDLLERLETMLLLIGKYWGRQNRHTIEMFVVRDLEKWPDGILNNKGLQSIRSGGGVTLGARRENALTGEILDTQAIVYAVADRGTPQHEAVHAFCLLNFGRMGPVWYAEGMAEMGQYWRDQDRSVNCHPEIVQYLKSQPPKQLTDITADNQISGDSWQNYAWRWALCHLLANNQNYSTRFHPLGMALLHGQRTSFTDVYGPMANEISFEYLQFLQNFDIGYRVDLCNWDWNAKHNKLTSRPVRAKVKAAAGWQPARITVQADSIYRYSTEGHWSVTAQKEQLSAAGQDDGTGRLEGVVFHDYELTEPFELGKGGEFTPPIDGKLFLRCRDRWNELADNSGEITVRFEKAEKTD